MIVITASFLVTTAMIQVDTDKWQSQFFIFTMVTVVIMTGNLILVFFFYLQCIFGV